MASALTAITNPDAITQTDGDARYALLTSNLRTRVSTQFDKTASTTLANVTGLSVTVTAGLTYAIRAELYTSADVTGGVKFALGGTATATAVIAEIATQASDASWNITRVTALASPSGGVAGDTAYRADIYGTITVNAGGTLTVQFAQSVANGTSSVLVGGTLFVELVV